ncbi:dihydrodipicolinate synthase family protein [Cuniculiplasma divulgatum]|uniref:4-hydroxy-tetrahydrodipicolinate synthase n=1 Tax=Cuniculiplasma divulgatum TaxID=1673428 RepID=A0A1N5VEV3_9ARCH|nr:dihydrodipicolinate synthase family protein [Cuniculiplasma divulgatum]SIM71266.1 4-hydroxy-tetrahydrodipicolinate synthase [Cuniculiplasma divulgatum]
MKTSNVEVICPMITPFDGEGKPSRENLKVFLDDMKEFGINKIFPLGSNGLFNLMTLETKKSFLKMIQEEASNFEVLVGVGSQNTEEAREMAKYAEDLGFDKIVLQPTYYNKAEQSWIIRHFEAVSEVFSGKFYIYNIPQFTGSRVEIDTMKSLVENIGRIEGIKDSSGDIRFFNEVAANFSDSLKVFQGQDDLLLQALSIGAKGGVCGTTNINPLVTDVYKYFVDGNISMATKTQRIFNQFFKMVNEYPFPSMVYAAFYRKHNIKGKLPDPITTIPRIVESKIMDVLNYTTHIEPQ